MIRSVEIMGLRGIQEGKLEDLTPLVVLVGPNGSGKSTILDALLIGANPNPGDAIGRSVRRRLGVSRGARWLLWRGGKGDETEIRVTTHKGAWRECLLSLDPAVPEKEQMARIWCDVLDKGASGQQRDIEGNHRVHVNFSPGNSYSSGELFIALEGVPDVSLIEAHESEPQAPLHQLYTKTVEQGRRKEARAIIAEVVPGVSDIEILTEGDSPIIYLVYEDYSVPAALAGDGIQSLLRLSLELASRPDGVVLLEEPEVHQHPGAIRQSARAILAAIRRGIQIVITTHSLELIDALLAEARDDEELEKLAVYRLQLKEGCLRSHCVPGPDVAFARTQIGDDLR